RASAGEYVVRSRDVHRVWNRPERSAAEFRARDSGVQNEVSRGRGGCWLARGDRGVDHMSDDADVPRETSPTVSDTSRTVELSDWLTKQQAADAIGVSTKAIERFAQAGKLEQRFRAQAHGPKVAVYFPDDVAKL